jgi:hypothetical protein
MATQESMAIRCNDALDRIEAAISNLHGSPVESVQRLYRDREMLRVIQLEQIANWLEALALAPATAQTPSKPKVIRKRAPRAKKAG